MPLKHQLVHPTAEIALLGLEHGGAPLVSPVCVVTTGSVLTTQGWKNMDNTSTFEPPFRLFRDGGRTYVQWVGEEDGREAAGGRVVRVGLLCRDAAHTSTPLFHPCLAFRVAGTHGMWEAALSAPPGGGGGGVVGEEWGSVGGLATGEGVVIGLVVAALALVYIVAMTVFCKVKKRRKRERDIARLVEEGAPVSGRGRDRGGGGRERSHRSLRHPPKPPSLLRTSDDPGEEIVDLSLGSKARRAARERRPMTYTGSMSRGGPGSHDPSDGLERVHSSPLDVVETLKEGGSGGGMMRGSGEGEGQEGSPDTQAKKKLYFNPAYFEPELLQSPPPAALEFLSKIREMISVAKTKMKNKSYHPSLEDIPEEQVSGGQSRHHVRSSLYGSAGRVTLHNLAREEEWHEEEIGGREGREEEEEEEDAVCASDVSVQSDSLERMKDNDSRSSTLKKLARRVNSHGESIVSEIIKTLDLKPRLPRSEGIYGNPHSLKLPPAAQVPPPRPPPRPVNARANSPEAEDDFPELIKPSMLRNVLRDGKRLTDLNNTFENFRQEMMATFQKMKKMGEAISPMSSLTRSKNKQKSSQENSQGKQEDEASSSSVAGEGKVHKWLQSLEGRNTYTRMTDSKNVVFDSRAATMPHMKGTLPPPPLPEKSSKPPTPPRKPRAPPYRSVSFSDAKQPAPPPPSVANSRSQDTKTSQHKQSQVKSQVTRSLSWQSEHRHYDSNPRRPHPNFPNSHEDLNNSFGSEDDSLNDLLSQAESKVPKMTPSDSDSVYSDSRSRYSKDSVDAKQDTDSISTSKSLSRQLPREEEMTARNEIYNTNTGATTMSRLGLYEKLKNQGSDEENSHFDDHTYEEIRFPSRNKQKRKAPQKPRTSTIGRGSSRRIMRELNEKRGKGGEEKKECSIYSNPDSLVSEVRIKDSSSPIYSGCKVTIPVADNMNAELKGGTKTSGYDQDTLERRGSGKAVNRSGSIALDSLERPKVKKRNEHDDKSDNSREPSRVQRRMTLPGEGMGSGKKGDRSLLDIYEARSSKSFRNTKTQDRGSLSLKPSRSADAASPKLRASASSVDDMNSKNSLNNRNRVNSLSKNSNNINGNDKSSVNSSKKSQQRSNDNQKNIRTFKDYQEMRFQRNTSNSDTVINTHNDSMSPLPVSGTSISLNFRNSSPSDKEQRDVRPPLPPKHIRNPEADDHCLPAVPPKASGAPPPLPLKANKRSDTIDSGGDKPKLPEKSRKKGHKEQPLSRSSSDGSIPELTEEEARSILHGVLAHSDMTRLSPLREEDDSERRNHFLGSGNTAGDCDSRASVPCLDVYSSGSLESPTSTPTFNLTFPRCGEDLSKVMDSTISRRIFISEGRGRDKDTEPGSPGSEARVSGEFILSTIGRSPSLRRQSSLGKEQTNGFLARLRNVIDGDLKNDEIVTGKNMEIALALKAKTDLEKHFREESGGESIKRTWRRMIEKVEDCKEEKERVSIRQLQKYMNHREKDTKLKQEDSGYHSTDSNDSAQNPSNSSNNNSITETSTSPTSTNNSIPSTESSNILSSSSNSNNNHHNRRSHTFNRAASLTNNNNAYTLSHFKSPCGLYSSPSYLNSLPPASSARQSHTSPNRPYLSQRSASLTHLGPCSLESSLSLTHTPRRNSYDFQRASLRASVGRRFQECRTPGGLSVYINNSFTDDDEDGGRNGGGARSRLR
ncbi:hypothetical protein Pcinc_035478 [Petrolisthes cinctipes]|uniref:Uncharacterized protein n=1 Tax=Petrolisthes cinctipes TaxID=88211 RepID=A0AAE1BXQ7_PETCI|nr:hypothetical protein Pcinc_035478 [Petrolisthes cinctipes]